MSVSAAISLRFLPALFTSCSKTALMVDSDCWTAWLTGDSPFPCSLRKLYTKVMLVSRIPNWQTGKQRCSACLQLTNENPSGRALLPATFQLPIENRREGASLPCVPRLAIGGQWMRGCFPCFPNCQLESFSHPGCQMKNHPSLSQRSGHSIFPDMLWLYSECSAYAFGLATVPNPICSATLSPTLIISSLSSWRRRAIISSRLTLIPLEM